MDIKIISLNPKLIAVLAIVAVGALGYYIYATDFKSQTTQPLSLSGYVVYESPAPYSFLILAASSTPVDGTLPTMEGFPALTDPGYRYISDADYKGKLPNVGDKISLTGTTDSAIETNPPYTFSDTASDMTVVLDAQFNATINGLIDAIK